MKRFFYFLKAIKKADNLLGLWHTNNDSGIHILYGSVISFEKNGKGKMNSWGGSDDADDTEDPKYDYEYFIEWTRVNNDTIRIRNVDAPEWTTLKYEITTPLGSYGVHYDKIISIVNHTTDEYIKEWFWDIPEALYRKQRN